MSEEPRYAAALHIATEAALAGGALLRAEFRRPDGPRGDDSHADVDIEVERMLRARLLAAFPGWGFLGEETGYVAPTDTHGGTHIWMVDPNDGTRAFLSGMRGSSVSIGLVRDGVPVLGVVYAPCAPDDAGDLVTWAEGCGPVRRQGREVARTWPERLDRHSVVAVSWDVYRARGTTLAIVSPARYRAVPSIAYRMALVAVGEADATFSGHGPAAWDYCAGHALVRGAGGALLDQHGQDVTYRLDGRSRVGSGFAGSRAVAEELRQRHRDVHGRSWRAASYGHVEALFPTILPAYGATVTDPGLLARAQGALLGQVAGDSLGSLVEFLTPEEIARRHPDRLRDLGDGGTWNTIAGQPTDDSELALLLARLLARRGAYDPEIAAHVYAWWLHTSPFDIGSTTRQALEAITDRTLRGRTAAAAARQAANRESQANGSLMRISPLGVYAHALPPAPAADLARADSSLTHPNPVCQEACAVFTVAVAHAIRTGATPAAVYQAALGWAEQHSRADAVTETLRAAATARPSSYVQQPGWALLALHNAFWQLLHAPSLEEGIVDTVNQGGDTDTTAAIAGALLGAVYGRDAVPLRWRRLVLTCRTIAGVEGVAHPRPADFWGVDVLELAERLLVVGRMAAEEGGGTQG
ncbi:MAG: ADP-ribosylglycohydrolase family protein [Chloroflexi bacterium]|nr:ADP-ribosylglycohydrolase family protein [Chloroflexota bacterium]